MLTPGQMVGNYKIVKQLGEGGMGAVFEGVHAQLGRHAAIKVLHAHLSSNPQVSARFLNEARAASIVEHPGIVEIFEFGQLDDGTTYIVMEFLRGESLTSRMTRGMTRADALRVTRQVASVLAAAHAKGIVHRDLKPDNVMLAPDPDSPSGERAKVLDFGIAKVAEEIQGPDAQQVKTMDGMLLGTPTYMSPEQCHGAKDTNDRSDVYSLGVMLYQMLTGALPFAGNSIAEIMHGHMYEAPKALAALDPSLPADLTRLVESMMAKQPAERPSMADVVAALQADGTLTTQHLPVPKKGQGGQRPAATGGSKVPLIIAGVGVAAVLAGVVPFALKKHKPQPPPEPPIVDRDKAKGHERETPPVTAPAGMARIAGARFTMGSTAAEIDHAFDWCKELGGACDKAIYEREAPQREVSVGPFFLDRNEVTNEAFARWLNDQSFTVEKEREVKDGDRLIANLHPLHGGVAYDAATQKFAPRPGAAKKPVVQVSWEGAQRFCAASGKRLPTEAQWELAARGPHGAPFPWGEAEPTCDGVVFGRSGKAACGVGKGDVDEVGTAAMDVSPDGVHDLGGNAAEWVRDLFAAPYPSCAPGCVDPVVAGDDGPTAMHVIRGGDWARPAESLRAAGRSRSPASSVQFNVGFRCVKELKEER